LTGNGLVPLPRSKATKMHYWKSLLAATAIAATFAPALATPIMSHTTYAWTLGGTTSGLGALTTGNPDAGGFDIVAFDGTINGTLITGLLGGQPGGEVTSPSGAFYYDNVIFNGSPLLDTGGVLFTLESGNEGNIWGTGPGDYSYYTGSGAGSYYTQNDSTEKFYVVPVSEPVTLSIFGAGLFAAGSLMRRKRKVSLQAA
jgi:hypothetical protein